MRVMVREPKFEFDAMTARYHEYVKAGAYARMLGWEFLWDWVQSNSTWPSLVSGKNHRTTALHLGFYLANWGMLRGSSGLLRVNLAFFDDLSAALLDGRQIPTRFWDMTLRDFGADAPKHDEAHELLGRVITTMKTFHDVSWTSTLLSKILLGLWGQIPAFDTNFNRGLRQYLKNNPKLRVRDRSDVFTSRTLEDLATLVAHNSWPISSYKTQRDRNPYPIGKVLDMAFFQYGLELARRTR